MNNYDTHLHILQAPVMSLSMIAAVYSFVLDVPPRSPVIVFPSAIVCIEVNIPGVARVYDRHLRRESPSRSSLHTRSGSCVCNEARRINQATRPIGTLTYLNIIKEDNKSAVGLANPFPMN